MGIRAENYIAIAPGSPVPPQDLIEKLSAEVLKTAAGMLLIFDTNSSPLRSRFASQPGQPKLLDLMVELQVISYLATVGASRFRWARAGDINDVAGEWDDHPFRTAVDVKMIEEQLQRAGLPSCLPEQSSEVGWLGRVTPIVF